MSPRSARGRSEGETGKGKDKDKGDERKAGEERRAGEEAKQRPTGVGSEEPLRR